MSVSNQETEFPYVGNGVTVTFPYNCQVQKAGDLDVYLAGLLITSGFTINGVGSTSGGSVTFSVAPAAGVDVLLSRQVELERTTDYQQNGDFLARVVNPDFDRIWMALQQTRSALARALRFPRSDVNPSTELPPAAQRANKLLSFDGDGNPITVAPSTDSATGVALALANAITAYASSLGARLIGFIQRGVGARFRTVENKLYDLVYVDDYEGDIPTRMERAAAEGSVVKFTPGETYLINRTVDIAGAGVTVDARGATLIGDGVSIIMGDPSESNWLDGTLNNIKVPWSIIRDPNTWADQTAADVTQSNDGYIPGGLDTDVTAGMTAEQLEWNKNIGIKLVFRSSNSTVRKNINVSGVRGRFMNLIFEGCSDVTVTNVKFKSGFEFGGVIFYNNVDVQRDPTFTDVFPPLGFTYAKGYRNKVLNSSIDGCNLAGIVFYGNDEWLVMGCDTNNTGESGVKTYQNDTHFGPGVICRYGKGIGCTSNYNRFDGYDLSATYPATGTQSGHNRLIACTAKGNRSTGVYSDAQSNTYIGNEVSDNGTFGMRIAGANSIVKNNTLENNVKFPGILGLTNVQDLSLEGDNIESAGNAIRRASPPPYTIAYLHVGTGGCSNVNSIPFPVSVDERVLIDVATSYNRISSTPTAFVQYLRMLEPTGGIQAAQVLHRPNSLGRIQQFFQGAGEVDVGSISVTATSTVYATTSDPRLKYGFRPLTGSGSFFDSLQPFSFKWRFNDEEDVGFNAAIHQQAARRSVTGYPDEVNEKGDPIYQNVAYGSPEWVTYATAEIQDMRRRLTALENKP